MMLDLLALRHLSRFDCQLLNLGIVCILGFVSGTTTADDHKPAYWDRAIDFTGDREIRSNLAGNLKGEVAFIQNTLVGPKRGDEKRPLLVTDRAACLVFFPAAPNANQDTEQASGVYQVLLRQQNGEELRLPLQPPWYQPRNDSGNSDGRPPVVYSKRAWTAVVPWTFMHFGLSVTIRNELGAEGRLDEDEFEFGPPIELVTQHIELGMLLPPSDVQVNLWCRPDQNQSPELAINYFQMVPVAKFIAAQYLPIHFPKVVMPNGNVYTERSTFEGAGVYDGDMRQDIAKGMVSTGINYANIGISSSAGGTEKQPRPFRQTTVHTSAGVYTERDENGNARSVTVRHGLSGGGGQLTLMNTTGNEFSHEYGHDHGLPHYPGGKELSVHSRNGAWGYDLFKHRLIGNLAWNDTPPETDFPYGFGADAMAGGKPMGKISVFTLHTPYSLNMIQDKVGSESGVLDPDSPTGYRKWDAAEQTMTVSNVDSPKADLIGVPVVTLLGLYDPIQPSDMPAFIYPALYGNWGNVFSPETIRNSDPALARSRCVLEVTDQRGTVYSFPLKDERIDPKVMNQFHVNLPASTRFVEAKLVFRAEQRIELDTRKIEAPHGTLPDPVIVGRKHGFTAAALRLRDMDAVLVPGGYPDAQQLHQAMEDYYGPILDHQPGIEFQVASVYRHRDGTYYQAIPPQPGETKIGFRKLGDSDRFLSKQRIKLGDESKDYAKDVMNGESGVYYYVPVDHVHVTQSDAPSPESATWYAKGTHSKMTVNAIARDGRQQPIVLRGQINGSHVINRGAPITESSRVRFTFQQEDNPNVPAGKYRIQFSAYAQGWHAKRLIESFQVVGVVDIRS
ncbi:Metalloprotease StcE precursor [Neorhodopirellula pilleata]|uniref:Metalloprotease StcE n=2 Tax=Neorhodopirellula pilleata TaxID=2714738 RepID=A0A5C6A7X3_9BACT|nr:Metalloprotease StcE precursor [Neorhodopirellula pilleata]